MKKTVPLNYEWVIRYNPKNINKQEIANVYPTIIRESTKYSGPMVC